MKKVLLLIFITCSLNAVGIKWQYELDDAKELAEHFKKPIFLFLESRRCYYCPIMKETTFTDKRVIETINKDFIAVVLDNSVGAESDVENNGNAPERLTTSVSPSIYFMGPNEEMLNRKGKKHMIIYGMWKADELLHWLGKAKKKFNKLHGEKYEK